MSSTKTNEQKLIEAMEALEIKEAEGKSKIAGLVEKVTNERSLPTSYTATLKKMAAEAREELLTALTGSNGSLQDRVDEVVVDEMNKEWEAIFAECSTSQAKSLATTEKTAKNLHAVSLVYGEVLFKSLASVLVKNCKFKPGGVFYDMGSGSGRGVFLAAVLHNFTKCHGVEYLSQLADASKQVKARYDEHFKKAIEERHASMISGDYKQTVIVENNDFRGYDLNDASLVFANSTCFDEDLMRRLAAMCERMEQGTYVVTFTKQLDSRHFKIIYSKQHEMSWGLATVIVHEKIQGPRARNEEDAKWAVDAKLPSQ